MIKIIKKGTKKVTICPACGCEFLYEDEDILTELDVFLGGYQPADRFIYCPQCKHRIELFTTK